MSRFRRPEGMGISAMRGQGSDGHLLVSGAVDGTTGAAKLLEINKVEVLCQPER